MYLPPITPAQLQTFRHIKQSFSIPKLPPKDTWRTASNDDVWIRVVGQVVVVGNAAPEARLREPAIRKRIKWNRLSNLTESDAKKEIWSVLREIGTRYSGKKFSSCRKTKALMNNLNVLRNSHGGPKGFLKSVATLPGSSAEKIAYISSRFSYVKDKGARDFLTTGFGLAKDRIALDIRIFGILRKIGISIPKDVQINSKVYEAFERFLLEHVCKPLKLTGAQLDQLLFANYDAILIMLENRRQM